MEVKNQIHLNYYNDFKDFNHVKTWAILFKRRIYNMNGEKKLNVIRIMKQLDHATFVLSSQIYSYEHLLLSYLNHAELITSHGNPQKSGFVLYGSGSTSKIQDGQRHSFDKDNAD